MGVAVLSGQELEYYGVKAVTRRSSPSTTHQTRQIIRRLIGLHNPEILAIERAFLGYGNRSSVLAVVSREIRQLGRKLGLEVVEINPKTAKELVAGNGGVTKREIARIIMARYPQLKIYLGLTHRYKEKYWQNMFDAVALGLSAAEGFHP